MSQYASLCRATCSLTTPCCWYEDYTHLPLAITEEDPNKVAQQQYETKPRMKPSAKRLLPSLGVLCRKFTNHRATSQDVIACIEEIAASGGDTFRHKLYEHVLVRNLDEERCATLLLSYHHKYNIVSARCHSALICFKCMRAASFQDGIHPDWSTCNEPPIKGRHIFECSRCFVTIVKAADSCSMLKLVWT